MMILTHLFLVLFVCGAYCEECVRHGSKCPVYTVLKKHEGYEERQYPALVWVSTSAPADSRNEVSRTLIKRLYGYLGGDNDKGITVDMMVPVRTAKIPSGDKFNYTMAMLVDPAHQDDPPIPTNPLLTLEKEPSTKYYVRSFDGMARSENIWDHQADLLKTSMSDVKDAEMFIYYRCVYDSPWREKDRLNEVWYRKIDRTNNDDTTTTDNY